MPVPTPRVLVVDDEPDLVEVLCAALRYEGWESLGVGSGEEAVAECRRWEPDAVVLDMMLPGLDGMAVLERIHAEQPQVRVLFLTARDAVEDRIAGIDAGGDDYVTKPFSLQEVVVRLRRLLRRAQGEDARGQGVPEGALVLGDLVLVEQSREVLRGGAPVELSPTEFQLLRYLMQHPRQVLSKAQILD
ncbi:response regulator transcription factor, partial [Kitasatospora sp. NPDC047058]|uniref:response regulator transcription factor n=1 Tax=Kitasatospora sp. NPDC047058 TaxID=3155620 RepID=UPI0033ED33FC